MYVPKSFSPPNDDALWSLIDQHNFAPLISHAGDALTATPLPFLTDRPRNALRSHMARANPHWRSFEIDVTRLEGKWKLSQNRSAADRAGAIAGLRAASDPAGLVLADVMEAESCPPRPPAGRPL